MRKRNLVPLACLLLVGLAASNAKRSALEKDSASTDSKPKETATELYERTRAEAKVARPDLPEEEALAEYAKKKVLNDPDPVVKRKSAALAVFSFLDREAARSAFCAANGVSIKPFVDAFERAHQAEVVAARKIVTEKEIQNQTEQGKDLFPKVAESDTRAYAAQAKMTVPQACQDFVARSAELVPAMHLSKAFPELHAILMGPNPPPAASSPR